MHEVICEFWTPNQNDREKGYMTGFGMTINIINGALECGWGSGAARERGQYFRKWMEWFGVGRDRFLGRSLGCEMMDGNMGAGGSAGRRTIYWEADLLGGGCVLSRWAGRWGVWMPDGYANCVKKIL